MNDKELIVAVERLRRSTGANWDEFATAFANYTTTKKDHCLSAETADREIAVGQARECVQLLELFTGKHSKQAQSIEERRK